MWGRLRGLCSVRRFVGALVLLPLVGCATHQATPTTAATPATVPAAERDATGAYRFNMTQHGRRMSADEFDAWMKARGIRVAKGAPAGAGKPSTATREVVQAGKAKPPGAKTIAARAAADKAAARPAAGSARSAPREAVAAVVVAAADNRAAAKPKPKRFAPAKPVEAASLQADKPEAKPVKRGEG